MSTQNGKPSNRTSDRKPNRALMEFDDSIHAHVADLHAACRDLLSHQDQTDTSSPHEVRIEIRSSLDRPESSAYGLPAADSSMECWDHTYPCGKGPNGYIYCTVRVCMLHR